MTKISYIHAIPAAENSDRGAEVQRARREYIPYLSLTEGEMQLELLRQRMQMFSAFYPDVPEYRRAVSMVDDVLKSGVHRGVSFVGAIPDDLQQVARVIDKAVSLTRPAAGNLLGRESIMNGIGEIIPTADSTLRRNNCIKSVNNSNLSYKEQQAGVKKCETLFEIERIYNGYIERVGHHTVYNRITQGWPDTPHRVFSKMILHDSGIEGMSNASELPKALISDWVENGVMAKNSAIGAGLIGSTTTSFYLSPEPEFLLAKYLEWQQQRPGAKVGIAPAVVIAIVGAIGAVVGAALQFMTELQKYKAFAMSEAKGFGTSAYSALQSDWPGGVMPPVPPVVDPNASDNRTGMLLAAAAGAYFLLNDD